VRSRFGVADAISRFGVADAISRFGVADAISQPVNSSGLIVIQPLTAINHA